jgi:hypothetical protein
MLLIQCLHKTNLFSYLEKIFASELLSLNLNSCSTQETNTITIHRNAVNMKLITLVILAFLVTLQNVNATEFSFNTTHSNDSLVTIANMTKMYNFDVFTELNLVLLAHKKALESGDFAEYNKVATKWNHIMRITGNKTIIELWNMPIRPEPKKEEPDNFIDENDTAYWRPAPIVPPARFLSERIESDPPSVEVGRL